MPKFNRAQIQRARQLLYMKYRPSELAEIIGCHLLQIYSAYIPAGCPHERDENEASDNTLVAYRKGLEVFVAWLVTNGITAGKVEPANVTQFKRDLKQRYRPQTVNLRLSAVRSFYRFAVATGRMLYNPASEIPEDR